MKTKAISRDALFSTEDSTRKAIQKNITKNVIDAKLANLSKSSQIELLAILIGIKEFDPEVQKYIRVRFCKIANMSEDELDDLLVNQFASQLNNNVKKNFI